MCLMFLLWQESLTEDLTFVFGLNVMGTFVIHFPFGKIKSLITRIVSFSPKEFLVC